MKTLAIEWKHLDKGGDTCLRCAETGKTVAEAVAKMKTACAREGIAVTFKETKLEPSRICESNEILFNGLAMHEILKGTKVSENVCESCSSLVGALTYCRTVKRGGETHEEIPESLSWEAARTVMGCNCRN